LFILDVAMPEMNGLELLNEIRARPETEETPVIMLTGRGDLGRGPLNATAADYNAYLLKPILAKDLLDKVRDLLSVGEGE
jgi:two-component system phosphate regulon response regulator PhoB